MNEIMNHDSPASSWMMQPAHSVDIKSTVRDVLEVMKREMLTCVPITNGGSAVAGVVTLGDLAQVVLDTDKLLDSDFPHYEDCYWAVDMIQKRFGSDKVTSVMSENVVCISPDVTMLEAANIMTEKRIHHLMVANEDELLGVLSTNDFVRLVAAVESPSTHSLSRGD